MSTLFPPTWSRYFDPAAAGVPPLQAARPMEWPRPKPAPVPPETPRQRRELEWVACLLPKDLRAEVARCLRCTLDFRAEERAGLRGAGDVSPEAKTPERTRFGPQGEALWPEPFEDLRKKLRTELEAILYTLENEQPRLVRNWMLAMHAARLGQLWWELAYRQQDALEEVREGLMLLWK